jgi:hypothetical protein
MPDDLYVRRIPRTDPRLGREVVHDERSRGFAMRTTVDRSTWRTRTLRIYDPSPNPNQIVGNCTGCAKAMQLNALGNRKSGVVLKMAQADSIYGLATTLDPWPGSWTAPSWEDTGSSFLAASKAAQQLGLGGRYEWIFNGADGVVQAVMEGHVVNVGTTWYQQMFDQDEEGFVTPGGSVAGGHEWSVRGYVEPKDALIGRCWWGPMFRDFYIKREHLNDLLMDNGDAGWQARA